MRSLLFAAWALPMAMPVAARVFDLNPNLDTRSTDGVLRFPLKASVGQPPSVSRRQFQADTQSQLAGTFYSIQISLGTPGQTVSVLLDTGSDELWVNPICVKSNNPGLCQEAGRFTSSSTYVTFNVQSGKQYPQGYVEYEYGADFVRIGRKTIPALLSSPCRLVCRWTRC